MTISAGGFLTVWCDSAAAPGPHSGFKLDVGRDDPAAERQHDRGCDLARRRRPADWPHERNWRLGAGGAVARRTNNVVQIGAATDLHQRMDGAPRHRRTGSNLQRRGCRSRWGLFVTDHLADPQNTLPALSYLAPGGFAKLFADGSKGGANHCVSSSAREATAFSSSRRTAWWFSIS
jgi:hypothetical protein